MTDLYTDLANARKFAKQPHKDLRYVAKSRRWYVWNGKRWCPDDTGELQRRATATVEGFLKKAVDSSEQKYAVAAQAARRIAGMLELATYTLRSGCSVLTISAHALLRSRR